jgi:hypothetical protein
MFCALGHVFSGTDGVGCRFHVFRALTRFRQYRGRLLPFSCFALPDTISAVPTASGLVLFCPPGLVFGGTEGVGSSVHVLHPLTCFRRYRGRQVPVSGLALPDSFSAVPRASAPVFMFCAPEHVFGGTEGVGSRFHVCSPSHVFSGTEGVGSRFNVCAPDSFSVVPRASGPIFMFHAPGNVFEGSEGFGSRFHVLRSRTHFRWSRGRWVPFSCFARPDSFSALPRA